MNYIRYKKMKMVFWEINGLTLYKDSEDVFWAATNQGYFEYELRYDQEQDIVLRGSRAHSITYTKVEE